MYISPFICYYNYQFIILGVERVNIENIDQLTMIIKSGHDCIDYLSNNLTMPKNSQIAILIELKLEHIFIKHD